MEKGCRVPDDSAVIFKCYLKLASSQEDSNLVMQLYNPTSIIILLKLELFLLSHLRYLKYWAMLAHVIFIISAPSESPYALKECKYINA